MTPILYTPMYIRQSIADPHGFIVRAERWNALWNLNIQQGDNNSQGIDNLTKGYNALRADYDNTVANTYNKTAVDTLLATKENKTVTAMHVKDVTFDKNTGVFTFTKEDGSFTAVDTALERVAIDVRLDPATSELILTLADGTEQRVSLASFIDTYTFKDSATIIWSALDKVYTPQIKPGSILIEHLGIPLQDTLAGYVNSAAASASAAEQSKIAAAGSATNASASAVDAQASKNAAALSEANAKGSETAAAGSKSNAAVSAQAAQTSALNSEASAVRSEDAARRAETIVGGDFATNTKVDAHTSDTNNPHGVTKAQVGLGNVDNTADADKPVSTAQQLAIGNAANEVLTAAKTFIPNENLLDNSDFTNLVNQRGAAVYDYLTGIGYGPDRWQLVEAKYTLASQTVTSTGSSHTYGSQLRQIIPLEKIKIGDTVTASIYTESGIWYGTVKLEVKTGTSVSNLPYAIEQDWGGVKIGCIKENVCHVIVFLKENKSVKINLVKLEKGDVATPYYPKGYGAELAECQRYSRVAFISIGAERSINTMLSYDMRSVPTFAVLNQIAGTSYPVFSNVTKQFCEVSILNPTVNYWTGTYLLSADL